MNMASRRLKIINPGIEELARNNIPDICLDECVVEIKDTVGNIYTATYYPNDYLGAYLSFSSKTAAPDEIHRFAQRIPGNLDERGVLNGYREEIILLSDSQSERRGVSQADLGNTLNSIAASMEMKILYVLYSRVPEAVDANTGFAPDKLQWHESP